MRGAIKAGFGTNRAFAKRLDVSEGRVSQLVGGEESITAATLTQVLAAFESPLLRERIHSAWVRTYAPDQTLPAVLEDRFEEAERLLEGFGDIVGAGRARLLLARLIELSDVISDRGLKLRLLRATIDLALYLGRPSLALRLSRDLGELARQEGSAFWTITALYTAATAARNSNSLPLSEVVAAHERFRIAADNLEPESLGKGTYRRPFRDIAIRDRILTMIRVAERKQIPLEEFGEAEVQLKRLLDAIDSVPGRALLLVTKGRLLTAAGNVFGAEDAIEEAQQNQASVSHDHDLRLGIASAEIQVSRGNEEGFANLEDLFEECVLVQNLHHAAVIERLLLHQAFPGHPRK